MDSVSKCNIFIPFYSRTGVTEQLALAVAEGAESAGAEVRLRRAREFLPKETMALVPGWAEAAAAMNERYPAPSTDDAEWADGIIFGTPTRFGNMAAELKAFIDGFGRLWAEGRLNGRAGSAFASTATQHGGNEATLLSMYVPMAHLGLIIVPPGYADPAMLAGGTPYGATAISENRATPPGPADLAAARFQGRRVAEVATVLRLLR